MSFMRNIALVSATTLLVSTALLAQVAAAPAEAPKPIDAVLVKDPSTLTPNEISGLQKKLADYANLARYASANAALPPAPKDRVVFYGDSITDAWGNGATNKSTFFAGKPYLDRGISGQTTPQMLVRFQQDVVALKPAAVLILAGTNDIAGNTGIESLEHIQDNFRSMAAIADANHIKVILASVLPVDDYPWRRGLQPADKIRAMNTWMQQFCKEHGYTYLDYYSALTSPTGGMKQDLAKDGVHPTPAGYAIMQPLAQAAIDKTIGK
ncbi:SGNH/GDSL hydrolase family protein [Terriglobus sp. RCC_193]|uniref:SGNH/GDSL hydrolase family protein n=1 Tax=Terriglobus sp. RCC_193 TaxID=3239218 RepID=UPI003523450E